MWGGEGSDEKLSGSANTLLYLILCHTFRHSFCVWLFPSMSVYCTVQYISLSPWVEICPPIVCATGAFARRGGREIWPRHATFGDFALPTFYFYFGTVGTMWGCFQLWCVCLLKRQCYERFSASVEPCWNIFVKSPRVSKIPHSQQFKIICESSPVS